MIQNKPHKLELWMFLIALFIVGVGLYYLGPSITGFVIKGFSYEDKPNLVITSNGNYTWQLQNAGDLKYVKLDGRVTNDGRARVYIENNGIKYLIFDSTQLNESNESGNLITGFAVKEDEDKSKEDKENETESDEDKKKKNKKPEWNGDDELAINGTTAINLSQYFTDKDGDALIYAASQVEGLAVSINNDIATITPTFDNGFNTTITFTASDGIDSKSQIVDLIVYVIKPEPISQQNRAPFWNSGIDNFTINGTTTINLSQYFIDEDNDSLIYNSGLVVNVTININNELMTLIPADGYFGSASTIFTAFDGKNLTTKSVALVVPKIIANITQKINHAPEWISEIDFFILNKTLTINLLQYFTDEDNDTLRFDVSDVADVSESISGTILNLNTEKDNFNTTITITADDGNLSASKDIRLIIPLTPIIINETNETITKTISIDLSYNSGTIYDANDNGEESINGVVDLTVEGTKFNWDVDKSKLCTRWEVYNIEEEKLTTFCNGDNDCCAFVNLLPTKSNWSEVYYSTFGKDDAGHNNIVSAQVLYYDVNLSIDSTKSEIYNSEWANLSVKFFEEEKEFFNVCLETCSLTGLNKSSYTLIFEIEDDAVLRIDKIKYGVLVDVINNPPLLLQNFSTINVSKNKNATINLSQYFNDPDGDVLIYSYYKADNITILFENNTAVILPDKGADGIRYAYITANDSENIAVSNVFVINISEEKFKPKVVVGKPVKWQSKILIDVSNVSSVNLTLPETASNLSIKILNETIEKELSDEKIKVIEDGKVKDKGVFEVEKKLGNINKKIGILEEARQKNASRVVIDDKDFDINEFDLKLAELYSKKSELEQQLSQLLNVNNNLITGNVVALTETIINETQPILFINESLAKNIEINVEYETEAPIAIEDELNAYTKQIKIVSETGYEDVLAYTALNDIPQNAIKLYWINNDIKELVNDVQYFDDNSNNLIDRIEWIIPHLSNQTYEVSITILNVQSYPTVGGNWTVAFNTTGTGNLTIYAYNGTSYAEKEIDNSDTINDLDALELKCDVNILEPLYIVELGNLSLDGLSEISGEVVKSINEKENKGFRGLLTLNSLSSTLAKSGKAPAYQADNWEINKYLNVFNLKNKENKNGFQNQANEPKDSPQVSIETKRSNIYKSFDFVSDVVHRRDGRIRQMRLAQDQMTPQVSRGFKSPSSEDVIFPLPPHKNKITDDNSINLNINKLNLKNNQNKIANGIADFFTVIPSAYALHLGNLTYPTITIEGKTYALLTKEQLTEHSYKLIGIYYENYNCDNKTGYWTVKVLTSGIHNQRFNFSNQIADAHNLASAAGTTTNGSKYQFIDDSDTDFLKGNLSHFGSSNTSRIVGNGTSANLTINISRNENQTQNLPYRGIGVNASVVLYLKFEEGTGQYANDSGFYGNNGTLGANNAAASDDPSWNTSTKFGSFGLSFDGSNDCLSVYNDTTAKSLNITGDIAIEFWIKTTEKRGTTRLIQKFGSASPNRGYAVEFSQVAPPDTLRFWSDGIGAWQQANTPVSDGQWHHFAVTGSGTTGTFYFDGRTDGTFTYTPPTDNGNVKLYIGCQDPTAWWFNGTLDEVIIYNISITNETILQHYQLGWGYFNTSNFTSQVFDANASVNWSYISWQTAGAYQTEIGRAYGDGFSITDDSLVTIVTYVVVDLDNYINLCSESEKNECKGRGMRVSEAKLAHMSLAQWIEPLSGVRGDASSSMIRDLNASLRAFSQAATRRAHTDLISKNKNIKEENQAHSLNKASVWRTGISHEFFLDSEIAKSHTVDNDGYIKYINVSIIPITKFQQLCPTLDCNVVDYITTKKKIKDIKESEYVLSLDEKTGRLVPRKVNALLDHGIKPIYEMTTDDERAINTTAEHPYLAKLYTKEECDKYANTFWNRIDKANTLNENSLNENSITEKYINEETLKFNNNENKYNKNVDDFEEKGYCTRWVEVSELRKGMEIAVPKLKEGYSTSNNFLMSSVENISTSDCSLNLFSLDQIAQSEDNANAKYGISLECPGNNSKAFASNFENSVLGTASIISDNSAKDIMNSKPPIPQNLQIFCLNKYNSSNAKSGAISLAPLRYTDLSKLLVKDSGLKNENSIDASTTINLICSSPNYGSPYLLARFSLYSSTSLEKSSSESLLFLNISSTTLNNSKTLSFSSTAVLNNDFAAGFSSSSPIISLNLSEISTLNSAILSSPQENNENEYLNVAESGIFFEKIASIKVLDKQHVYDLEIENTHNFIANDIIAHNTAAKESAYINTTGLVLLMHFNNETGESERKLDEIHNIATETNLVLYMPLDSANARELKENGSTVLLMHFNNDTGSGENDGINGITQSDGQTIGNMTSGGGLASAFDGNSSQDTETGAKSPSVDTVAAIGKDWGAAKTRIITKYIINGSTNRGFSGSGAEPTITLQLQGSTDNFVSSIVTLATNTTTDASGISKVINTNIDTITAYRYHRVLITSSVADSMHVAELEFFEKSLFLNNATFANGTCVLADSLCPVFNESNAKFGRAALEFDGTDDLLNFSNYTTMHPYSSDFSISAWVKTSATGARKDIAGYTNAAGNGDFWQFSIDSNNNAWFRYSSDAQATLRSAVGTSNVADGNWHYIAGVRDGATVRIYVDGAQQATGTGDTGEILNTGATVGIGVVGASMPRISFFKGTIDEVAIYNVSLSSEIIAKHSGYGIDKSIYGNNATLMNGSRINQSGKFQEAMQFDGKSGYLIFNDSVAWDITGDFFASCWYKANGRLNYRSCLGSLTLSSAESVYTGWALGNDFISASNQPAKFVHYPGTGTTADLNIIGTTDVNDGVWHHLGVSRSGSSWRLFVDGVQEGSKNLSGTVVGGSGLTIGKVWTNRNSVDSDFINGTIDEVAIWNISLSSDKISEHAGAKVLDYSQYGNNGTRTNQGTDFGRNFTAGKFAKGLVFDGVNDCINVYNDTLVKSLNITGDIAIEFWIKTDKTQTTIKPIQKYNGGATNEGYAIMFDQDASTGKLQFWSDGIGAWQKASTSVSDGQWHHFAVTGSGTVGTFYFDGRKDGTFTYTPPTNNAAERLYIGCNEAVNGYFDGTLDEVAIWNVSLSLEDIRKHYERGVLKLNLSYRTSNDNSTWTAWTGVGNNTLSAVGFSIADDSLVTVTDYVAVRNNYYDSLPNKISNASEGVITLSGNAFFNRLSPDSILQSNFSDKATYGASFKCDVIDAASFALSKNELKGIISTDLLMNSSTSEISSLDSFDSEINLSRLSPSSEYIYCVEINSNFSNISFNSNTKRDLPLVTNAENTTLKSTTKIIVYEPFVSFLEYFIPAESRNLFDKDKLTSSANSSACFSVNLDFDTIDSILFILDNFSLNSSFKNLENNNCHIFSGIFLPSTISNSLLTSSGTLNSTSAILSSPPENNENGYLNVVEDYSIIPINEFKQICPSLDCDVVNYVTTKKKIKDIKEGDYVQSFDEKTGKISPRKVNALVDHGVRPINELKTESGRAINTTAEHPYLVKLYSKEECDKYKESFWNRIDEKHSLNENSLTITKSTITGTTSEIVNINDEFEQKGYCARWIEVSNLREGMEIAVPRLENNVPGLLGGVKSSLKTLEIPPVLPQDEASLIHLSDYDKLGHGTVDSLENEKYKSFYSDIEFEKIASITALEPQHVYDLSIEGTHNFIANDIIAHNTARYFQYKVAFNTTDARFTPILYNVSINYSLRSNLTIFDDTEKRIVIVNEWFNFTANFTDFVNPINGSNINCTISLNSTGSYAAPIKMNYSAQNKYYYYETSYLNKTIANFNITCDATPLGFNLMKTIDDFNVTVARVSLFNGSTTDFNNLAAFDNVSNAILEVTTFGKITWLNPINVTGADLNRYVNISPNLVNVTIENLHRTLNSSANITLYNVYVESPRIFRNGTICPETVCKLISYNGVNITFNVTSFSSYSGANGTLNITINLNVSTVLNTGVPVAVSGHINLSNGTNASNNLIRIFLDATEQATGNNITDTSQSDFTSGINNLTNATASSGNVVLVNDTSSSVTKYFSRGNFTSRIFDATGITNWTNISFATEVPYQRDLEDLKNASMVLLMHFDNGTGENNSLFLDYSQYANNGNCSGVACPVYNFSSKFGRYALTFDDSSSQLNIPFSKSLNFSGTEQTVEAWINPNSSTTARRGIFSRCGGPYFQLSIWNNRDMLTYFIYNEDSSASDYVNSVSTIPKNVWTHVAGVYNKNELRLYINGVQDNSTTTSITVLSLANAQLSIGWDICNAAFRFNGTIDEPALWNVSLDNATIKQHALRGFGNLSLQARTCTQSDCSDNPLFSGNNGSGSYFTNISTIYNLNFSNARYFQYRAYLSTNSTNLTPMLQEVNVSYKGIFTDSFGNYNYTLTAPSTAATYTVKVNATYANIPGEQTATLSVTSIPVINANYTIPTFPMFNKNVTIVANVTDANNNILYINFTIIAPNGTRFNLTNGSKVGDLHNASINLTSYGTWIWNISVTDADGFIVNMTGTGQIILMQITEDLSASTVSNTGVPVAVSGHINLSNGTNVSNNAMFIFVDGNDANITSGFTGNGINFTDTSQGDFTSGINNLTNATASSGNVVLVNDTSSSVTKYFSRGNFTSRIFNATTFVNWTNISFATEVPYQRDLEDLKNASLRLLMHFDNATGENDTYFADFSQFNNFGNCSGTGCPLINKTTYKFGKSSAWFDGSTRYLSVGNDSSLYMPQFTIELWVRVEGIGSSNPRILSDFDPAADRYSYDLALQGTGGGTCPATQEFFAQTRGVGASVLSCSGVVLTTGQWYYLTVTYDQSVIATFVDGIQKNQTAFTDVPPTGGGNTTLGRTGSYSGFYFNGMIDEVAIWNVSLSNDTIKQHALRGFGNLSLQARTCTNSDCSDAPSFGTTYFTNASAQNNVGFSIADDSLVTVVTDVVVENKDKEVKEKTEFHNQVLQTDSAALTELNNVKTYTYINFSVLSDDLSNAGVAQSGTAADSDSAVLTDLRVRSSALESKSEVPSSSAQSLYISNDIIIPIAEFQQLCPTLDCNVIDYITTKKKIKDVKADDYVLSLNDLGDSENNKLVPARVKALADHGTQPIREMTTESGRAINTTAEHPYLAKLYSKEDCYKYAETFWNRMDKTNTLNKNSINENIDDFEESGYCTRWIEVAYLKPGMEIAVPDGDGIKWEKISSINILDQQHVYDLAIENTHNFIANDIIAHNTGRYFQYRAYLSTNSTNLTPMLQEVNVSYKGIFTDSFGNYNYTLTAPTSAGTSTIKVNTTYANITGEQTATLRVIQAPVINANYTIPTFPIFGRNVTIVANVTDADNTVTSVNFTLIAPNGTRFNLSTNTKVGDLYNVSLNLTSYGTWLWNVSAYDSDGFIANMTGTGQIILMQITENLNVSTTTTSQPVAVSGHINLSNGTNVSYNLIDFSSDGLIRWRWYDDISDSILFDFRVPILINSSIERTQAPISATGKELNDSISGINLSNINTTTLAVVDALGAGTSNERFGKRVNRNFNDVTNDVYFNLTDSVEWNADIAANTRKLYYIYYEANVK